MTPDRPTCEGTTKAGKPCKAKRRAGTQFCPKHQPDASANVGGRPTKLNAKLLDEIATYVTEGAYIETACRLADVSKQTYYTWRQRGEDDRRTGQDTIHSQFLDALEKADAVAEHQAMAFAKSGGMGWQAGYRYLESRFRARWSRTEIFKHEVEPDPEDTIDVSQLSLEDIRALREIKARAQAQGASTSD